MTRQWRTDVPPHRVVVEVKTQNGPLRMVSVRGGNGYTTHWETPAGDRWFPAGEFTEWREVQP